MKHTLLFCALAMLAWGCSDDESPNTTPSRVATMLNLTSADTWITGANDNAEIIRAVPNSNQAILIASKAKKITKLTHNNDGSISATKVSNPVSAQNDDDELTSGNLIDDKTMLVTHTMLVKTGDKITACRGEVVALSLEDATFGNVVGRVDVGPMPDAVAISPNKHWAISADEHDSAEAWGKCPIEDVSPSVTLIDLSDGAANMKPVARITFTRNALGPREPEYVAIASDNDTVQVTLQDSHEVAVFKISDVLSHAKSDNALIELTEQDIKIVALPQNDKGENAWPDGIITFDIAQKPYFVIAGEWNDTIITLDQTGELVSNVKIRETEVPSNYPCAIDVQTPLYSPDSLTMFVHDQHSYVAATLRHAGAVIVYNFDDPTRPAFAGIAKVGSKDNTSCDKAGSIVRPEGISATSDGIWTANEGESSVSLIQL